MSRKTIVYCDDQQRFRDAFVERHQNRYEIITVKDARDLVTTIERLKKMPDLVLLDLFHPRNDDDDYEEKAAAAEASLAKLDLQIEETNNAVFDAWEPSGLEVLKLIRQKHSVQDLPVAIYSQKGLILLGDEKLHEAETNGAEWILKKKLSARTEQLIMDKIIQRKSQLQSNKGDSKYRWLLAFSWLIIGLLATRIFFNSNQWTDFAVTLTVGVITALVSYLFAPLITRIDKKD